jgi:nucleoside-diphosphate-sugar epimerase
MREQILILGSGYVGRFLIAEAGSQSRIVLSTSRDPDRRLMHLAPSQRLRFDLAQPDTWRNIPADTDLVWCFPATPLELVQAFAKTLGAPPRPLVVLGSTSAYDERDSSTAYPPPWIDESAAIDLRKPRVKGEEYLRKEHGAIVLRIAGIYGPGRNPIEWIRSGRVGPIRKYVNLIHVVDLAAICLAALARGESGEVYNVSDGTPRPWADICRMAQTRWGVTAHKGGNDNRPGKRIKTIALRERLGAVIRHPDLQAELEKLEGMRR